MGSLVKLNIASFTDPACAGKGINSIDAFINPTTYTRTYKVEYDVPKIVGDSSNTSIFAKMGPETFRLEKLFVDGTGIVPLKGASSVDDYITKFKKVVYDYNGEIHRPCYLKLTWGNLTFKGVCTDISIEYVLFSPDGTALRAYISLTLQESIDVASKNSKAAKSSPDLTHKRTVVAGDSLPLLTYQIYGDSSYYMFVAKQNGLLSPYDIKPGDEIFFPPIVKSN